MANHIGVIGAGVMGEALIAALIRSGENPSQISFAEKRSERATELPKRAEIELIVLPATKEMTRVLGRQCGASSSSVAGRSCGFTTKRRIVESAATLLKSL